MSMSRKDYEAFAAAVRREGNVWDQDSEGYAAVDALAFRIASIFAADNPRFDRERFLAACGLS